MIELRFHIDKGGLTDLSNGETSLERLHRAVLGPWYERRTAGGIRGIRQLVNRSTLEKAFDNLLEGDPRALADELWTTGMLEFQQTLSTPVGGAKVCPPNWQREWTGHTTGCGMSFPDAGVVGLPRDPQKQGSVHGASR